MLVELGLVEQRYAAVREVLEGTTVVDVARRNGVARQTVHGWLRKYATGGMARWLLAQIRRLPTRPVSAVSKPADGSFEGRPSRVSAGSWVR